MSNKSNVEVLVEQLGALAKLRRIDALTWTELRAAIKADRAAGLSMENLDRVRASRDRWQDDAADLLAEVERLQQRWQKERDFGTSKAEEVMHLTERAERAEQALATAKADVLDGVLALSRDCEDSNGQTYEAIPTEYVRAKAEEVRRNAE